MKTVQAYKIKIDRIIDRLPEAKVEELLDYAVYLGSRYSPRQEGVTGESLLLQQVALKKFGITPRKISMTYDQEIRGITRCVSP